MSCWEEVGGKEMENGKKKKELNVNKIYGFFLGLNDFYIVKNAIVL